ncbi:hypothetical protein XH96_28130 [Bradyrhizobium sp. CCBAU 51765]|nr:hypothetical protein XH96_28130 [Bradyrhizobium sp. CCBAU 51765]
MDFAEAGFIYGLPIVMNYAIMYECVVAYNSSRCPVGPSTPHAGQGAGSVLRFRNWSNSMPCASHQTP